jgi:hypothetical protein
MQDPTTGDRAKSAAVHCRVTRNRLLFLQATEAVSRPLLYTLVIEYLRIMLRWSLQSGGIRPSTEVQ